MLALGTAAATRTASVSARALATTPSGLPWRSRIRRRTIEEPVSPSVRPCTASQPAWPSRPTSTPGSLQNRGSWSEPGVDVGRLGQAGWDAVQGRTDGETGSSIVLRLIRLRQGSPDGVVARARALTLAVRVAAAVPKASILEAYLNSLPYGNRAVGVEAAAITYFQVDAGQLALALASLIAGLPEAPDRLDPLRHLPQARERQRQVLDAMVRAGAVTRQQADQAFAEPLQLVGPA